MPPRAPLKMEISKVSMSSSGTGVTGITISPTKADAARAAQQREIDKIWRELNDKVVKLAQQEHKELQEDLGIEDILRQVDAYRHKTDKPEKFAWFKSTLAKTLQCIKNVGDIVVTGVSEVFGPAQMCYNALTFVIQAWQGYEGIFENLAELLERCVSFLERLIYYDGRMDVRLAHIACQNLHLFVMICDHTIHLRRKRFKALAFVKQFFLNDNDIQGLLGEMDKLNAKENLLVSAQTLQNTNLLLEGQKEQKKEEEAKARRRTIAKVLGFPDAALGTDEEPIPTWQRAFDARKNNLVRGTGKWIRNQRVFLDWMKSANVRNSVLVLEGIHGAGKSSLMANALRFLRKSEEGERGGRIVTAYYFADANKRKPDDEDKADFLETVSRTLLWQVAIAYETMTKSMYKIAKTTRDFDGSLDLWKQLFVDNSERISGEVTFYFFIDADETDIQGITQLLDVLNRASDKKGIRILLTSTPQTTSGWLRTQTNLNISVVPMSKHNAPDIDLYINDRMDQMPIFKDSERSGISEWRNKILETLRRKCKGDYFRLNTSLDALTKVDLIEDINYVLENADKSRSDQIDTAIRQLNNIRTLKEIQEINEIMLWVDTGRRWLSVENIEAILAIKHQRSLSKPAIEGSPSLMGRGTGYSSPSRDTAAPSTAALTISLLPLKQKLLEKYDPLFTVRTADTLDWRSMEVRERIPSKASVNDNTFSVTLTGPQVIQETEINIVRHFLHNVCPPELYQRFEFEQFFDAKLGARQKEYICLDPDNADIRIASTCLTILTEEGPNSIKPLREYASFWLLDHLRDTDLSAADRELKGEIGPLLVRLLTEERGIDAMFWPHELYVSMKTWRAGENANLQEARGEWVYSAEGVKQVATWLKDSSVVKYVREEPGLSFIEAAKANHANLHEVFLAPAAKHMAHHMFRRPEFTPRQFLSAARFIRGFLHRLDPEKSARMEDDASNYIGKAKGTGELEQNFTIEEINNIEAWASEVLGRSADDQVLASQWEIHGALAVYQLCRSAGGAPEEGAEDVWMRRAQRAIDLDPRNWHACHFIASREATTDQQAVNLLQRAKSEIEQEHLRVDHKKWLSEGPNSALLARITLELGDRYWSMGKDPALAARTHRESLKIDYVHFSQYAKLLIEYQKKGAWSEVVAFVEAINQSSEIWAPFLDDLVHEFLINPQAPGTWILARAADETARWEVVQTFFTLAVDLGKKQQAYDLLFYIRDSLAKTLGAAMHDPFRATAINTQEEALVDLEAHPSDKISFYAIQEMKESLARGYLHMAFMPDTATEKRQYYGEEIEKLIPDLDHAPDVFTYIERTCCLIRFHHKQKTESKTVTAWIHRMVRAGLELLSDGDYDNDDSAYWVFTRLFTTVSDAENMKISWMLFNHIQVKFQERWAARLQAHATSLITASVATESATMDAVDDVEVISDELTRKGSQPIIFTERANGDLRRHSTSKINGAKKAVDAQTTTFRAASPLLKTAGSVPHASHFRHDSADRGTESDTLQDPSRRSPRSPSPGPPGSGEPFEPTWIIACDGCGRRWTVMDVAVWACADCVGTQHLCVDCKPRMDAGELARSGLALDLVCRPGHDMMLVPPWDPALAGVLPKDGVPLPEPAADGRRCITMDEWKDRLRKKYLST